MFFVIGDIKGDDNREIILSQDGTISVFNRHGTLIREKTVEGVGFEHGIIADLDNQGKQELVFGAREDKSGRLIGLNGLLHILFDHSFTEMVKGNTCPAFFFENHLYFHAVSSLSISPKLVGAFNVDDSTIAWLRTIGPVPTAVHRGATSGLITVSNRGVSRDREKREVSITPEQGRQALYLFNQNVEEEFSLPVGPQPHNGYVLDDGISGIKTKLFDINNDGKDEFIVLLERVSELYRGRSRLQIRDLNGKIIADHLSPSGPSGTEGSFGFVSNGEDRFIVMVWEKPGIIQLLDDSLNVLREQELPGRIHHTRLRRIGDFTGRNEISFLVTDHKRLYLLDKNLDVVCSTVFDSRIQEAQPFPGDDGTLRLAVLTDSLSILQPTSEKRAVLEVYTDPPGARVFLDDNELDPEALPVVKNLAPGKHTLQAVVGDRKSKEVQLEPDAGEIATVTLSIPSQDKGDAAGQEFYAAIDPELSPADTPEVTLDSYAELEHRVSKAHEGYTVYSVADFTGDKKEELFLYNNDLHKVRILDASLHLVRQFSLDLHELFRYKMFADFDMDGKKDLITNYRKPYGFSVRNGDGRVIFEKEIGYGFDTHLGPAYCSQDILLLGVNTGYLLSPRGYYGCTPPEYDISFFYPMALSHRHNRLVREHDRFVSSVRTVSNGAVLHHDNGVVERDDQLFLHVFGKDGTMLPESQLLGPETRAGGLQPFSFDSNDDGEREVYILEYKYPGYYNGTPRLFRLQKETGDVELLHTGPANAQAKMPTAFRKNGEPYLCLRWFKPDFQLDFLDSSFSLQKRFRLPVPGKPDTFFHPLLVQFLDLDGDETSEIIARHKNFFYIFDLEGTLTHSFPVTENKEDTIRSHHISDLDGDGKDELIVSCTNTLAVYGY